jgi:hypothetical protein
LVSISDHNFTYQMVEVNSCYNFGFHLHFTIGLSNDVRFAIEVLKMLIGFRLSICRLFLSSLVESLDISNSVLTNKSHKSQKVLIDLDRLAASFSRSVTTYFSYFSTEDTNYLSCIDLDIDWYQLSTLPCCLLLVYVT